MSEREDLEKHLADLKRQREEITEQETATGRAIRIADFYGIDIKGWKLDEGCGPYGMMGVKPKAGIIFICAPYMKGETDESLAYDLAHEVSHKKTTDEALATLYAIEMLKDKIPSNSLKGMASEWYDAHMSSTPEEKLLYPADFKYLEKVRKYVTGEEEIKKQKSPVKQKAPPKKEKKVSFEEMIDIIDRYQRDQGQVVAGLNEGDTQMNFFMPKDVFDKIDGKMTVEEVTDLLMGIPWGRNWSLGMAKAVYGPIRWGALPEGEKEIIMKDLVRRKLVPPLLGK